MLITPRLWTESPYWPFTEKLDLVILVHPSQLRIFCESATNFEIYPASNVSEETTAYVPEVALL